MSGERECTCVMRPHLAEGEYDTEGCPIDGETTPEDTVPQGGDGVSEVVERWMAEWLVSQHCDDIPSEIHMKLADVGDRGVECEAGVAAAIANAIVDALTLIHDLQVDASSEKRWADEYCAKYERPRADRRDVLSVTSTDGLSSSEWLLRRAKAEAENERLRKQNERLKRALREYGRPENWRTGGLYGPTWRPDHKRVGIPAWEDPTHIANLALGRQPG